jgi:hypothetical protein
VAARPDREQAIHAGSSSLGFSYADLRFLLPEGPDSAIVIGGDRPFEDELAYAGVSVGGDSADVAIAPAARVREALGVEASSLLLLGRPPLAVLRRAGYNAASYLPLPSERAWTTLVPLGEGVTTRYAVDRFLGTGQTGSRIRYDIAGAVLSRSAARRLPGAITVAARGALAPFMQTAAECHGAPSGCAAIVARSAGSDVSLRRVVMHLVDAEGIPRSIVKFARLPGLGHPIEREAAGRARAAAAGPVVSTRLPGTYARFEHAGLHASLEAAVAGERLDHLLHGQESREVKLAAVGDVVEWLLAVSRETAAPAETLDPLRAYLNEAILPVWAPYGAPRDLVARVPPVAGVFQHGDLGAVHVIRSDREFRVVDWENARAHSLPLWDLLYFLRDALARIDGAQDDDARVRHFLRLFRGELATSAVLRSAVLRAMDEASVPSTAAGPLATLERLAHAWLADPRLGAAWMPR